MAVVLGSAVVTQTEVGAEEQRQIPTMIFLNRPKDSLAPDDGKQRPLRILGQVSGPNGEIIEAKTGKVVAPACGQTFPVDNGLGEGEDRLELVEDLALPSLGGGGGGQRTPVGWSPRLARTSRGVANRDLWPGGASSAW